MSTESEIGHERERMSLLLGVRLEELEYIVDIPGEMRFEAIESPAASEEDVPEIEVAIAESLGVVVPNRISYGVYLRQAGFTGNDVLWEWLGPDCSRTSWTKVWGSSINRWERAGYCRRPQTDLYDVRWRIYWRA